MSNLGHPTGLAYHFSNILGNIFGSQYLALNFHQLLERLLDMLIDVPTFQILCNIFPYPCFTQIAYTQVGGQSQNQGQVQFLGHGCQTGSQPIMMVNPAGQGGIVGQPHGQCILVQPYGQMVQPVNTTTGQPDQPTSTGGTGQLGQLGQPGQQYILMPAGNNMMMLQPVATGKPSL